MDCPQERLIAPAEVKLERQSRFSGPPGRLRTLAASQRFKSNSDSGPLPPTGVSIDSCQEAEPGGDQLSGPGLPTVKCV